MQSRRHFAKTLGAGACLLPFLRPAPARAAGSSRRLIVVWSLSTNIDFWRPLSAPGAPIAFNDANSPLAAIADDVVLVDGLSPQHPDETHSTPQALTGRGFSASQFLSVDQLIAQKLGLPAPLLLGVQSSAESQFMNSGRSGAANGRLAPNDDPRNAFGQLFGMSLPQTNAGGQGLPRRRILDITAQQIRRLQGSLGAEQRLKLEQHLDAVDNLQKSLDPQATPQAGCKPPSRPDLGGAEPADQRSSIAVGEAHRELIVGSLGCGLTSVVGMQWGISSVQYLSGTLNYDEHAAVHTQGARQQVVAAERYLCDWFIRLLRGLRDTPDPAGGGKSLFDTTLVVWTRDFGTQSPGAHINYSMPYVLAGATDYLKRQKGGRYLNFGGDNNSFTRGVPHERLLLNCCEAMGVSDSSGFGGLADGSADKKPLAELRA